MVASRGQNVRAQARRAALEAQAVKRAKEREREQRRADLGVAVAVALAQREEAVRAHEQEAGEALGALLEDGLSAADAVDWCGVQGLTVREVQRLRKVATAVPDDQDQGEAATAQKEAASLPAPGGGAGSE